MTIINKGKATGYAFPSEDFAGMLEIYILDEQGDMVNQDRTLTSVDGAPVLVNQWNQILSENF